MPKSKPTPPAKPLSFTARMFALRLTRNDGTHFLANGVHGHPRLHADREDANKFRADLEDGRVVRVRVTIQETRR